MKKRMLTGFLYACVLMALLTVIIVVKEKVQQAGDGRLNIARKHCLQTLGANWAEATHYTGHKRYYCEKEGDSLPNGQKVFRRVHAEDKNRDGRIRKADGEMWCEDGQGEQMACQLVSYAAAGEICSREGGTWIRSDNGYECRMTRAGLSQFFQDRNGDGFVGMDEYHCEAVDRDGNSSGNVITCPMDDFSVR